MKKRVIWILAVMLMVLAACTPQPETTQTTLSTQVTQPARLELELEGEQTITLEFGTQYAEAGAKALYYAPGGELSAVEVQVQISGQVEQKLGSYTLTYTASHEGLTQTGKRTVHIVDTTPPEITLVTNPESFTQLGEAYTEEGFQAMDACDGDLTDKVIREEKDGKVTYTVTDASGNQTQIVREIVYGDKIPPQIYLQGSTTITMTAGAAYPEPGYTATDNCDGDITQKVTVSGLDRYIAGTYTVVYTVTDSYGNTAQATRTVTVQPVRQTETVQPGGKTIYLTFDDGPGAHTQRLLDVLEKYNVKATFFVVGAYGTAYMDLLPEMYAAGHAIGMHSVSHDYDTIYASQEAFFEDLYAMQKVIYDYTGHWSTLMRFPGGSSNQVSDTSMKKLVQAVTDQGFQYFDWNVSSGDAGETTDTNQVFLNVTNGIKGRNVAVVLQHDIKAFSVDAVERIIVWGLANGYTFLPLTPDSPGAHHKPAY